MLEHLDIWVRIVGPWAQLITLGVLPALALLWAKVLQPLGHRMTVVATVPELLATHTQHEEAHAREVRAELMASNKTVRAEFVAAQERLREQIADLQAVLQGHIVEEAQTLGVLKYLVEEATRVAAAATAAIVEHTASEDPKLERLDARLAHIERRSHERRSTDPLEPQA